MLAGVILTIERETWNMIGRIDYHDCYQWDSSQLSTPGGHFEPQSEGSESAKYMDAISPHKPLQRLRNIQVKGE